MTFLLLAVALLLYPGRPSPITRLRPPAGRVRAPTRTPPDPFALPTAWDLLAAALRSGLPVATAVAAVLPGVPPEPAGRLRTVGDLLRLGADPVTAWAP
ncbi:MAG: secretion system protein, partial [Saccharothrix sp.]|nr:secretion system protein [Saccharothrix sp.]